MTDADVGLYSAGLYRAKIVLGHYRSFHLAEVHLGARFDAWLERMFEHEVFRRTCSDEGLYLDSYER